MFAGACLIAEMKHGAWQRIANIAIATLVTAALSTSSVPPATAAEPYCPNPTHATPAQVPAELVAAVARPFTLHSPSAGAASVGGAGNKLLGCSVGANLVCAKAERRRTLPGATAWCRDNPGSNVIPMSATGHATIFAWSCNGRRAVAGR